MKKYKILFTLMAVILIFSCITEGNEIQTKTVNLKFENNLSDKSKNQQSFTIYSITMNSLGEVELNDENLELVEAIEESTQKQSFMIIEKNTTNVNKTSSKHSKQQKWERGYFFDGECFVYGTMIYGDNGVNLFVACGINCIGFDDVCPEWNEAFV